MKTSQLKELVQSEEAISFIKKHLDFDTSKLLFKFGKDEARKILIGQIASRQAIRKKLPTYYQNYNLLFPPKQNLEQSSSEAIAKMKAELLPEGEKLADLSAGFGVDFQQLMEKYQKGLHLEPNPELSEIAAFNLKQTLPGKDLRFVQAKAEDFLKENTEGFDLIYLDPSRRDENRKPLYRPEEYQPNILAIKSQLLASSPLVLVKLSPMISIPEYLSLLPETKEVWVLSERNECKELSFLLSRENSNEKPFFRCLNQGYLHLERLECYPPDHVDINILEPQEYLYLPNASILKGGLQDYCASQFSLAKLDPNSNLFTSNKYHQNYPGRIFKVHSVNKAYAPSLKGKSLQVISRNFPDSPEKISQKLKLKKKGASDFLIATKSQKRLTFILAELIVPSMEGYGG